MPFAHELSRLMLFAPNWWRTYAELTTGHYDKTGLVRNAALRAHVSQMDGIDDLDALLGGWNGMNAKAAGMPDGHYAEAFWVMETG